MEIEPNKETLSYKGSVSGLKGLLSTVVSKIDQVAQVAGQVSQGLVDKKEGVTRIAIQDIQPCPDQPRSFFDPDSLQELAKTLKEVGQAQAITVRKISSNKFEIISGERRYRAAKLAGIQELDCLVKECTPEEGRLLALVENTQRQDLLAMEEAFYLKRVVEENPGLSLEKLAKKLGSHKSTLSEKIKLTEIPEDLQKMLFTHNGRYFTHRHWRVISRIQDQDFMREMFRNAVEKQISVAELERSLSAAGVKKQLRVRSNGEGGQQTLALYSRNGQVLKLRGISIDLATMDDLKREALRSQLREIENLLDQKIEENNSVNA